MKHSKRKGDNFERKIAKILSDRFASFLGNKRGFLRNLGSGARFGGKNSIQASLITEEIKTVGDIVTPKSFRFNIECKHYAEAPSFKAILTQSVSLFDKWIEQAELDHKTMGTDYWCVIMKFNLVPESVILPDTLISEFPDYIIKYKTNIIIGLDYFLSKPDDFYFKGGTKQ